MKSKLKHSSVYHYLPPPHSPCVQLHKSFVPIKTFQSAKCLTMHF